MSSFGEEIIFYLSKMDMHGSKQNDVFRCLHSSYLREILHKKYHYNFFGSRNKTAKSMSRENPAAGQKRTGDLLGNGTVVTDIPRMLRVCGLLVGDSADVQLHACYYYYY